MAPRANATVKRSSATNHADLFRFARINDPRTLLDLRPRDAVLARGEVMVAMAMPSFASRSGPRFFGSHESHLLPEMWSRSRPVLRDVSKTTPRRHHPVPLRQEYRCQGDGRHAPTARRPLPYSSSRPRSSTMRGGSLLKSLSRSQSGRTRTCVIPGQLNRSRPCG